MQVPLPHLDEDGCIDLDTSMRLAIPRDRLQCFVDWGAARSRLPRPAKFDTGIVGWRNSVPIHVASWHASCLLEPMNWPVHAPARVPPSAVDPSWPLTNPFVPLWCRATQEAPPTHVRFRVRDDSLTWHMHSSFDDWDAARLVNTFDQFLGRFMVVHADRKRKREGFQDWSATEAIITRRTQCPLTLLVCIMFLVHAVAPSADDPQVLVFPVKGGGTVDAIVVVLDPSALQACC